MTQHLPAVAHVNDFTSIPTKVRQEVHALEILFNNAMQSKSARKVLAEAATQFRRGWSRQALERKYYAWKKSGCSWTALIDRAKVKPKPIAVQGYITEDKTTLSNAFLNHYRQLCLDNQRNDSAAFQKLCLTWRSGEEIPGYGTWRQWWMSENGGTVPAICPGLPRGWSRRNLSRFAPPQVEKVAARIGHSAARSLAPLVFTTRVKLDVGQFYMFDDLWHDLKVNFVGVNTRAMRPLELACLDVFSGSKIAYGLKPVIEDLAADKLKMLTGLEMRFLVAHVLINIGFHKDGCYMIVEHGTAAIPEWLEKLLFDISGGRIRVQRSGIDNAAAFAGAYCGRSKGNFRLKAALESHHNLPHAYLADLEGQTGPQERFGPEELHGRQRHNDALLQVMAALPPERAALIRLPLIHFPQFAQVYGEMHDIIECRDWHNLEGFEEAGLVKLMLEIDKSMPPLQADKLTHLPADKRAALEAAARPYYRKMSPREVVRSRSASLEKVPASAAALILPEKVIERSVGGDGIFEFDDRSLGLGTHRYLAVVQTPEGFTRRLRDKETYGTLINPFDSSAMIVLDAAGSVLGTCPRWEKIDRADHEAMTRQMGKATKELNERIAPLAAQGRKIIKRLADTKHNLAVVNNEPITAEEHERAAAMKEFVPADLVVTSGEDEDREEFGPTFSAERLL